MFYRTKPVIKEAIQYTGLNSIENIIDTFGKSFEDALLGIDNIDYTFKIKTLEGVHKVLMNDYIIKGIKGEFYPCKPDIFEATYEKFEA